MIALAVDAAAPPRRTRLEVRTPSVKRIQYIKMFNNNQI